MVEQPLELSAGEIWIDEQSGARRDFVFAVAQAFADIVAAAALPHDRATHRTPVLALPHNESFALIGNADCSKVSIPEPRLRERLASESHDRAVDLFGVVLDPSGLRKV